LKAIASIALRRKKIVRISEMEIREKANGKLIEILKGFPGKYLRVYYKEFG
jgi:hypothetical protein